MEHFQSAIPVRLYNSKGRTYAKNMFHGGCIFVDHASGYIQVWHRVIFSDDNTIKTKLLYERDAANYGVRIQAYHTD